MKKLFVALFILVSVSVFSYTLRDIEYILGSKHRGARLL
jgi:membrane-bound metal-dependent hydrolase YbcI (DUF457 family)